MTLILDDTIAAIASAPGGGLRGIVRISGPDVIDVVEQCLRNAARVDPRTSGTGADRPNEDIDNAQSLPTSPSLLSPSMDLRGGTQPMVVDSHLELNDLIRELPCRIYLWPTARSYTRQPTAEFHTFGSPPLLEAVLKRICQLGPRLARPGEFTLRAFLAGRIDLPQAEAILGTIDAVSEQELSIALRQMAGGLSSTLNHLRDELLNALADLEAGLDFVEDDIQFISNDELVSRLDQARNTIRELLRRMSVRDVAAREPRVALMGSPNVGKSSLLNALADDSAALVADCPGTTRDYVERRITFGSLTCAVVDTAGLVAQSPTAPISTASQAVARKQQRDAHLRLFCVDGSRPLDAWEEAELRNVSSDCIVVETKADLSRHIRLEIDAVATSSHTGQGIAELRKAITDHLIHAEGPGEQVIAQTATRCHDSLRRTEESLTRALELVTSHAGDELVADELRLSLYELGTVVGAVYTDDILERIFSRFCIGK